jgi:DNA-binding transcriptional regulator LsrR (DeoR family)
MIGKIELDRLHEAKQMLLCAELHYKQQKQQQKIAHQLGLSTSKVSRLLRKAIDEGVVTVQITPPVLAGLSVELTRAYALRDAIVIPSGDAEERKEELGVAAARYFERVAGDHSKVGLSCGMTLYCLIKNLEGGLSKHLTILPLAAEDSPSSVTLSPNTLVGMMAAKYRPEYVSAYALLGTKQSDVEVSKVYDEALSVDIAVFGIGALEPALPGFCRLANLQGLSPDRLRALGAVGEVNYQPFDGTGSPIDSPEVRSISKRILCVPTFDLKAMALAPGKLVVGIGGGLHKVAAISGALKAGLCNVLITDQDVARALLDARPKDVGRSMH